MKLMYIGNAFYNDTITIGKIYEVTIVTTNGYGIINDNGGYCEYPGFNFIILGKSKMEIRNEKIDKLLE